MKENLAVRNKARKSGVPLWAIAAKLEISEATMIRWLRFPLSEERERQILAAIDELSEAEGT